VSAPQSSESSGRRGRRARGAADVSTVLRGRQPRGGNGRYFGYRQQRYFFDDTLKHAALLGRGECFALSRWDVTGNGGRVRMSHLRDAARTEYAKLEKPLTDAEIGDWV
jgi:hypothetical protein